MKIRFLNPVEQVTGSCYWLKDDERKTEFLVDCGMVQGEHDADAWNQRPFEFRPADLKCVFLTHTHIDHCGLLPRLAKEGFRGPVFCTRESAALAKIALADSVKRGAPYTQEDVDKLSFREPSAERLFGTLHPFDTDRFFGCYRSAHIVGGVAIQIVWGPKPAPGAPNIQRTITFSGDLGCNQEGQEHQALLRHRMRPPPADYAVVESTYGATVRPPHECDFHARIRRLKDAIDRGLFERKGPVIIPCFAIDRTQAVLFDLQQIYRAEPTRYAHVPVFLSAPMAARVNLIYGDAMKRKESIKANVLKPLWRNKRLGEWLGIDDDVLGEQRLEAYLAEIFSSPEANGLTRFNRGTGLEEPRERPKPDVIYTTLNKANTKLFERRPDLPAIIVTGGGMCDGGHVVDYFKNLLPVPSTTVLLTGYMGAKTVGGQLLAHARLPAEERLRSSDHLQLGDNARMPLREVAATIDRVSGYSGHADQSGLLDWLFSVHKDRPNLAGRTIFITHGEEEARRGLRAAIEAKAAEWASRFPGLPAIEVHLPRRLDRGRWFDLDHGVWLEPEATAPSIAGDRLAELEARVAATESRLAAAEARVAAVEEVIRRQR